MFGSFSDTELSSIVDAVKFARANLQRQVKRQLIVGTEVKWRSQKHPLGEQGKVVKIAQKYVTVNTGRTLWRVPANMLEVV